MLTLAITLLEMMSSPENNNDTTIQELQYQISRYEDQSAYKSLFFLLFPSLQNFAYSIVRSRVLAEEIASDILLEVWVRRQKLMEIESLKLYLFVSVKNASIAKLKQENKLSHFSIDDLHVEFVSDYSSPDQVTELHQLEQVVAKAVKELPSSCQLIYKLAKEDRLKYKEIAELLDLSVKTIDNQLSIALKRIGQAVNSYSSKKNHP